MLAMIVALIGLDGGFQAEATKASEDFREVQSHREELLLQGDLKEIHRRLLAAVPKERRSAAHAFVLTCWFLDEDAELAAELGQEALSKDPTNCEVQVEAALALHRAKRFADAEKIWASVQPPDAGQLAAARAMRADCLLHLARYADANDAWKSADAGKHWDRVRNSAHWTHCLDSNDAQRARMLGSLASGDVTRAEPLIYLDTHWTYPDESVARDDYLKHDFPLVEVKLGKESARCCELRALAEYCFLLWEQRFPSGDITEAGSPLNLREVATKLGWLHDPHPKLAQSSLVAKHLFAQMIWRKIVTADELLASFEPELRERARGGDSDAADALHDLHRRSKTSKSSDLDAFLFESAGELEAEKHLIAKEGSKLKTDSKLLVDALAKHPDDRVILRAAAESAAREQKPSVELAGRWACAELTEATNSMSAQAAFDMLDRALAAQH